MTQNKNEKYDSSNIQVLEGLEAVRKRPGMYIGNIDIKGLHHLIWEIADNAIDEALAGFATRITLALNEDGSCTVSDNGRGVPVDIHPKTKKPTVETIFTILHAGGKFGGESSVYKVSGGLHGVGASVVNAMSDYLIARIYKNNIEYLIEFEKGGIVKTPLKEIGPTTKKGTEVTFKPSFDQFNNGVDKFDFELVKTRMKETAYLNKGLEILVEDNRKHESVVYKYDGGLVDFVSELTKNIDPINDRIVNNEGEAEGVNVEVAFRYVHSYQPRILSFVNNIITSDGGTHVQGFFDAILRIINNYASNNLPKKEQISFLRDDIKEGLVAIISIKHPDPMYDGQTKSKFANSEVRKIVNKIISNEFEKYLLENPDQALLIVAKLKQAANSRVAAEKAKDATRRKGILEITSLPGKLADCSSKDRTRTELFIVEGDSAGGSAKMGRDREIQAILPLRGKVINAEKARIDKLFANNEILSLMTAIGTGIKEEFDIEKIRYGKIIIMTDADVDGAHIRTLILTFFYRYLLQLIEGGHLYIACPPLFKITRGSKETYVYTDEERDKLVNEYQEENLKFSIQRYKGLGEMNDTQLWETTMDPDKRKLLRVSIDDAVRADQAFSDLMGELVEPRKEFIDKNAKYAKLDI